MSERIAHILDQKWRSDDIKIEENVDFTSLLLPRELLKGLKMAGFKYPSPIQLKAIPIGKIGKDLIVQAKSGTGKTLVFTVIALNMLLKDTTHPQVLIMAPTREIAFQICKCIKEVGCRYKGFACEYFIGGCKLEEDVPRIQGCQVIVGTPGRIKQLINYKILKTGGIRLFVLDEADQLLNESSFTKDIDDIFRALPRDKQMIATSATYPDKLKRLIEKYFRIPLLIQLNKHDIGLLGMAHYYHVIPVTKLRVVAYKAKLLFLEKILTSVKFGQCLVFCNMISRVENLSVEIQNWGFSTAFISSARGQEDRLKAIEFLKKFKCKILVSSDVSSRGIDAENVDLVINFDLPTYLDVYFHRVGRAGRYGSKCASVTLITSDEIQSYQRMQNEGNFKSYPLPDCIPEGLISMQTETEIIVKDEESSGNDKLESSSNSSFSDDLNEDGVDLKENGIGIKENTIGIKENIIDLNENGVDKHEKSHDCTELKLNDHNELHISNVKEFNSESLVDSGVVSTESGDSQEIQNQLLNISPDPTCSGKEDDDFSSTSDLELANACLIAGELKQQEIKTDLCLSTKIVSVEKENENLTRESCENDKLVKNESAHENCSAFIIEDIKSCQPEKLLNDVLGLQQIIDENSCLADSESICEKSLKKEIIKSKSLVVNSDSKIINNDSKELFYSATNFINEYESENMETEIITAFITKYSQAITAEPNDDEISSELLEGLRSSSRRYYYDVLKSFTESISEGLANEIIPGCEKESVIQVSEIKDLNHLEQNGENQIQCSSLDSKPVLFISTPKMEVASGSKSGHSSGLESSSEIDNDNLIEHFNLMFASINKEKPSHQNLSAEGSSSSELDSDTSVNSKDAMHLLTEEFNKVTMKGAKSHPGKANIIKNTELSSSSSDSDSGTSIDSNNIADELEKKFTKFIKNKRSDGSSSKDTTETKRILEKIKSKNKCFKGIEIVDTKKPAESSSIISSDSAVDTKKQGKSPSSGSSDTDTSQDAKRIKGASLNAKSSKSSKKKKKISNTTRNTSGVDQYFKESQSSLQSGHQRNIHGKSLRSKTVKGDVQNKITYYYSETESDIDQYSSKAPNLPKMDEASPKIEPSYSNANETTNPYLNTANEMPTFNPSNYYYPLQPRNYASHPYYQPFTQQIQSHANHASFLGTQFGHQMQPTTFAYNSYYQPYPIECPLRESCQMSRMQHSRSRHSAGNSDFRMNSNSSLNPVGSNYQQQPPHAYNQCFEPSQHPCHPPNETCQSPVCAAFYDTFYKQWQLLNQHRYY